MVVINDNIKKNIAIYNRFVRYVISVIVILIFTSQILFANEAFVGYGTNNKPYILETKEDIYRLSENVNKGIDYYGKYFKITKDIELDKDFVSIGSLIDKNMDEGAGVNINPFSGIFDGDNHTITFAKFSKPLFSYCREAEIKNLNIYCTFIDGFALVDNYVMDFGKTGKGTHNAKSVVKINNVNLLKGTNVKKCGYIGIENDYKFGITSKNIVEIENCVINDGVRMGLGDDGTILNYNKCGSFAGEFNGIIKNCKSYAILYGNNYVGGIAGVQSNAMGQCILSDNKFYGSIISTGKYVGGILGSGFNKNSSAPNAGNIVVNNNTIYPNSLISAKDYVGGIVGNVNTVQNWRNVPTEIKKNNFFAKIKCDNKNKGLIVGKLRSINKYCYIENNFAINSKDNIKELPFGYVEYIDTHKNNLKVQEGLIYIDTSNGTNNLPKISIDGFGYMEWKENHNRDDDPLFDDLSELFEYVDVATKSSLININVFDTVVLECELLDENYEIKYEDNITPLSILQSSGLDVYTKTTIYGEYIYRINDKEEKTGLMHGSGWVYYINGEFGKLACDKYKCKKNDVITWKYISW